MKQLLSLIAIITMLSTQAQTLEKTYTNEQPYYYQAGQNEGVWASWQPSSRTLKIYDLQHNLIKTIVANVQETDLYQVLFVSRTLFNADNEFEFLLSGVGSCYVIREDGTPSLSKIKDGSNSYAGYVYNTPNGTAKLRVTTTSGAEIYALSGKIFMGKKDLTNEDTEILPYPNPATEYLFISDAGISFIDITDLSARFTKRLNVNNGSVDIRELSPGMYFYTIKGNTRSFVKQ